MNKMIALNFNKPLYNIKGEDTNQILGDLLADVLVTESKGNAVKIYDWATVLASGGLLVVDKADFKWLEDYITNSDRMIILLRAQLLRVLDEKPIANATVSEPEPAHELAR